MEPAGVCGRNQQPTWEWALETLETGLGDGASDLFRGSGVGHLMRGGGPETWADRDDPLTHARGRGRGAYD